MIVNHNNLKIFVDEYNKKLYSGQEMLTGKIQKAFSSAHFITLSIRFPGVTRYLFLGRGNHYEGLWENSKNIPSPLRMKDRYLDYIRKYLVGARTSEIHSDHLDRIIYIPYYKNGQMNMFSLFWKGRSFYFLNIFTNERGEKQIYTCWKLLKDNVLTIENESNEELIRIANKYWDELGRTRSESSTKKAQIKTIDEYFDESLKKTSRKVFPGRKKKFFQRKISRIEMDLKKVKVWRDLAQTLQQENFVLPKEYEFKILDIKFKASMEWNEHKRKNIIFEKIKKFKKAEGILEKRLSDCRLEFSDWCDGNRYEDVGKGKVCTPVWHSSSKKQQKLEVNDENIKIFEYYINESIKFAVGKNSQSNDYLRIKWGKKNDYWFHIDGMKSAHLIIKVDSLNQLSQEHLIIIASVLRDYSSLDITSIPVVFTQVKNLKGVKGRAGAVLLKKQKYLTLNYEKNWKEIISRD